MFCTTHKYYPSRAEARKVWKRFQKQLRKTSTSSFTVFSQGKWWLAVVIENQADEDFVDSLDWGMGKDGQLDRQIVEKLIFRRIEKVGEAQGFYIL